MGSVVNGSEPAFTPGMAAKMMTAEDKASRDFRSDVVTVPTVGMMQAGRPQHHI